MNDNCTCIIIIITKLIIIIRLKLSLRLNASSDRISLKIAERDAGSHLRTISLYNYSWHNVFRKFVLCVILPLSVFVNVIRQQNELYVAVSFSHVYKSVFLLLLYVDSVAPL